MGPEAGNGPALGKHTRNMGEYETHERDKHAARRAKRGRVSKKRLCGEVPWSHQRANQSGSIKKIDCWGRGNKKSTFCKATRERQPGKVEKRLGETQKSHRWTLCISTGETRYSRYWTKQRESIAAERKPRQPRTRPTRKARGRECWRPMG